MVFGIFENSKHQILNNCMIEERKGGESAGVMNNPEYLTYQT